MKFKTADGTRVILMACCFCWCLHPPLHGQTNPKTILGVRDFLNEYLNFSSLPLYQQDTYCGQVSSYDTTGGNDDGFSGKYSQLYRNADSTLTIFEMKGPGVIQRIWTPTPSDDSLDFYIDDPVRPAFTLRYRDLFSGKVYPFVAPLCNNQLGGFYCYLPIPFNRSCKIVYKGKKTQFHQIQYRIFPPSTGLHSFQLPFSATEKKALVDISTYWSSPILSQGTKSEGSAMPVIQSRKKFNIQPGQTVPIFSSQTGGRIRGIELGPVIAFEGLEKNVDIKITWDNEAYPAVYCPVADFFGYAYGKASMRSLLIGSDASKNYCYFPMPFDRASRIELIYRKNESRPSSPIAIESNILFQNSARKPSMEGKFYTQWSAKTTVTGQPHTLLEIKGKGHMVGTSLQAQGLKPGMTLFFEGDDSTAIDGQHRMLGTGSEDFFNGGWYALLDRWDGPYSLPLSGSLDYSLPFCRTGGYRLFIGDKISFEQSLFQSIEHGPTGNTFPGWYTSTSYYYCDRPAANNQIPAASSTRVHQPDTMILYPQILPFSLEGDIHSVTKWAYPTGGETYYFTVQTGSFIRTGLAEIPDGDYDLSLDYIKSPESCEFSIWQRQTPLTDPIQAYHEQALRVESQKMCKLHIDRLNQTITFQFKTEPGKNKFILNRIILTRLSD